MEEVFKYLVLIMGMLDSYKYHFLAQKMARYKSSRDVSRKFTNIAILYRIFLFIYAYCLLDDWVISISCIIALLTLGETFWYGYIFYPFKDKKKKKFKKPSVFKYLIHSLTPNKFNKKL